jgi:hypothetical protein
MSYIKFKVIGTDDDIINLSISVSNGEYSATQDIYIYRHDILKFGNALKNFPRKPDEEVIFEYGSDDNSFYCYAKIRAFIFDNAGHPAIEILFNNHREAPDYAKSHFYIKCEVNTLNKLGSALCTWSDDINKPIQMEL